MYLRSLSLTNFRNYVRQAFAFAPGHVLLLGENAQGKTNVLEAIFLLVAGRSERAASDADLIHWDARGDPQPVARVEGTAARTSGEVTVELAIVGRQGARGLVASKRFKVNGVPRRQTDAAGNITGVLFTTDDMDLVRGSPSGRRRYLDVMLSQADRAYGRALSKYNKLVTQRNALLKQIQEGRGKRDELDYWDEELSREAAVLTLARARAICQLAPAAADAHARLSGEREEFALRYEPRFAEGWPAERVAEADAGALSQVFLEKLRAVHARDIAAGVTLSGPHRDDLTMTLGGEPASSFASRGQQRTAALALRLAEARFLFERSGERPVLLLDDVLSELDEHRRASVLGALDADQTLITSPDADRFATLIAAGAQVWHIAAGRAERIAPD